LVEVFRMGAGGIMKLSALQSTCVRYLPGRHNAWNPKALILTVVTIYSVRLALGIQYATI